MQPIKTHRETTYQAPAQVVWQAILRSMPAAMGTATVVDEQPQAAAIVFSRDVAASIWEHARFTVTAGPQGTHVRVDREISRGYSHGLTDVFDFYGQEAQKWLSLVQQEIGRIQGESPPVQR